LLKYRQDLFVGLLLGRGPVWITCPIWTGHVPFLERTRRCPPEGGCAAWTCRSRSHRKVGKIEYRCPAHGWIELPNDGAPVSACPLTRSKRVGGRVVVEPCGLRLIVSSDQARPTRVVTEEDRHDDKLVLRAAVDRGEESFDAISLLAVPALQEWVHENMELAQGRVQRALDRLDADGLVERRDAGYGVTLTGNRRSRSR
jgi:hypothetical protein